MMSSSVRFLLYGGNVNVPQQTRRIGDNQVQALYGANAYNNISTNEQNHIILKGTDDTNSGDRVIVQSDAVVSNPNAFAEESSFSNARVFADLGKGRDWLNLGGHCNFFTALMGEGNDVTTIGDLKNTDGNQAVVNGGEGDDSLTFDKVEGVKNNHVTFIGGEGNDNIALAGFGLADIKTVTRNSVGQYTLTLTDNNKVTFDNSVERLNFGKSQTGFSLKEFLQAYPPKLTKTTFPSECLPSPKSPQLPLLPQPDILLAE